MPYLKHVFRYQEYRRTQFLNTMSKDDLGRHRGGVLYGMKLIPKGSAVHVDAGALYTPFGTKIFWEARANDVAPLVGVVDLSPVLSDVTQRPLIVTVVAEFPVNMEQASRAQPPIEGADDVTGATPPVTFKAFVASYRQDTARPGFDLDARHPVEMAKAADGWAPVDAGASTDALRTVDPLVDPSTAGAIRIAPGVSEAKAAAVKAHQILVGYIILGGVTGQAAPTTLGDGTWAPGVVYVPVMNPWQTLQSVLGIDPLMGRTADLVDGGVAEDTTDGRSAFEQKAPARCMANGASFVGAPLGAPRFGTPNATVAGFDPTASTYRFPNLFRDGDSILDAMKRLDYLLRLWMNKTGDQAIVRTVQDGTAGQLDRFAKLESIIYRMDGQKGPGAHNLNTANWGSDNDLPLNLGSDPLAAAVTPGIDNDPVENHVLKSGLVTHVPAQLDIVAMQDAGDSHRQAIRALDWTIYHLLQDIIGVSFKRSWLRLDGAWTSQKMTAWTDTPAGVPVDNTGKTGVQSGFVFRPTIEVAPALAGMVASDFNVYLGNETLTGAIEGVALRSSSNVGPNMIKNPVFAKTGTVTNPGTPQDWSVDGGTTWQIIPNTGGTGTARRFSATLAASGGYLRQRVDLTSNPHLLGSLLDCGIMSLSVSMAQLSIGSVRVCVKLLDAGLATLLDIGDYVPQTGVSEADGYTTLSFTLKFPACRSNTGAATAARTALLAAVKHISVEITNVDPSTKAVSVAGVHLGAGMPPLLPIANMDYYEFVNREGGIDSVMRNTQYLSPNGLRFEPRALPGAPTTGTWDAGALVMDPDGRYWRAVSGGTPGSWEELAGVQLGQVADFVGAVPAGYIPADGSVYTASGITLSDGSSAVYTGGLTWAKLARLRDYLIASGAWGNTDPARLVTPNLIGRVTLGAGTSLGGVTRIDVTGGGSGYGAPPLVTVAPPGTPGGQTATAVAVLENGVVARIDVTDSGSGYTAVPAVSFASGAATATAVISLSPRTLGTRSGEETHKLTVSEQAVNTSDTSPAFRERSGGHGIHPGPASYTGAPHGTMPPFAVVNRGIKY